jgi:phage tail P2-like protein
MADYRDPTQQPDLAILPPVLRADDRSIAIAHYLSTIRDLLAERAFIYDLDAVPTAAIEPLIDQLSAREFVIDGLDEATVRSLLRESFAIHRRKGTPYAVARLLEILGTVVDLREWWQQTPRGLPHTFQAIFWRDANPDLQFEIDEAFFATVVRLVESAKPERSTFDLYVGFRFAANNPNDNPTPPPDSTDRGLAVGSVSSTTPKIRTPQHRFDYTPPAAISAVGSVAAMHPVVIVG